jgi:predicted amidophosphoribosyltransferase
VVSVRQTLRAEREDNVCPTCGRRSRPSDLFCAGCGTQLNAACAGCGRAVRSTDLFCPACGAILTGESWPDRPLTTSASKSLSA